MYCLTNTPGLLLILYFISATPSTSPTTTNIVIWLLVKSLIDFAVVSGVFEKKKGNEGD